MKKSLLTKLAVAPLLLLPTLNLNADTLYVTSNTRYNFGTPEYREFRINFESHMSKICEARKYGSGKYHHFLSRVNSGPFTRLDLEAMKIFSTTDNSNRVLTLSKNIHAPLTLTSFKEGFYEFNIQCR